MAGSGCLKMSLQLSEICLVSDTKNNLVLHSFKARLKNFSRLIFPPLTIRSGQPLTYSWN